MSRKDLGINDVPKIDEVRRSEIHAHAESLPASDDEGEKDPLMPIHRSSHKSDRHSAAETYRTVTEVSVDAQGKKKETMRSSTAQAAFNLFRSIVGTTFLAIPFICELIGVKLLLFLAIFLLLAVFYGVYLIIEVADDLDYKGPSYEKLIVIVMKSPTVVNISKVMLVLLQVFKVVGHNLFIVEVLVHIFCRQGFPAKYCHSREFYVICSFIISAPTYLILNISFYSYISLGSVVSVTALIAALIYSSATQLIQKGFAPQRVPDFYKLPVAFSLITHSLQGIGMIMPIRSSMENKDNFRAVQKWVTLIVAVLYFSTAIILALAFGVDIKPIVVLTFSKQYTVIFVLTIIYAVIVFLTYPLHLFPVYTIIINTRWCKRYISAAPDHEEKNKRTKVVLYGSRLLCLIVIYAIVYPGPDFVAFLSLVGAVFATTFLFIFPVLLYNKHFKEKGQLTEASHLFNLIFMWLMIAVAAYSAQDSIRHMFKRS